MRSIRLKGALLACLLIVVAVSVVAQDAQDPQALLQQATKLYFGQRYDSAMARVEMVLDQEPHNPRAWMLKGHILKAQEDYDGAGAAFENAAEESAAADDKPGQANAWYEIGLVYSAKGEVDAAFEWLFKARDTNTFNVTQIGNDASSHNLREDKRWMELFPSAEAFADPFVEETKVIHVWDGEAEGDAFGWVARNVGDVDGDKVDDFVTTAPFRKREGGPAGKIYVYSGASGKLLWDAEGESPTDRLGMSADTAGDVNADGIPDVAAGAPGGSVAYVYSGNDGAVIHTFKGEEGINYGREAMSPGDVNGDGYSDVLVGAPGDKRNGNAAGAAHIYSGKDGSELLVILGEEAGDGLGSAAGGMSTESHPIIIVGAANAGPGDRGRTYVHNDLSGKPAFIIDADDTGSQLGRMFVSVVGDVNADGEPDIYASDWADAALGPIIVGAWQQSTAAPSGGKVYLYSGKDGKLVRTWTCRVPGDTFGFDATGIGDVDGDGTIDFLLTSGFSPVKGTWTGRTFIISGAEGAH
jgi:hypothetical protein